jgi:hypothetical protein
VVYFFPTKFVRHEAFATKITRVDEGECNFQKAKATNVLNDKFCRKNQTTNCIFIELTQPFVPVIIKVKNNVECIGNLNEHPIICTNHKALSVIVKMYIPRDTCNLCMTFFN